MKTNAKGIVAAAIAAALTAGIAAAPALAAPCVTTEQAPIAVVAQSVGSDDAICAAVDATPITWCDVYATDWYYDCGRNDYVVTVTANWGDSWVVWVDAATGAAYLMA